MLAFSRAFEREVYLVDAHLRCAVDVRFLRAAAQFLQRLVSH
jgi:hypothetical protein